jgi:hypothetical protein
MRSNLVRRVNIAERVRNFAPRASSNRAGRGVYTMTLLRRARSIVAEETRFGGCAVDAIRQAARVLDLNDEIQFASRVMMHVCGPEVIMRAISKLPEKQRDPFRRRLLLNFDNAYDVLLESSKPSPKALLARAAGAEASNWAGLTKAEKDANWAATLERAVEELDRARIVENSVALARKLYPNREAPASDPEPHPAVAAE